MREHNSIDAKGQFKIASWGKHVVMQLKSPEGEKITCFFGHKDTVAGGAILLGSAASLAGFCLMLPFVYETKLMVSFFTLYVMAIMGPTQGAIFSSEEVINRKTKDLKKHKYAAILFPIDQAKFDVMKADLQKPRFYLYGVLFNNCANHALRFGRKHGFDMPQSVFQTPLTVRLWIRGQQKKAKAIQVP